MKKSLSICCDGQSMAMSKVKEILNKLIREKVEKGYTRILFYDFNDLEYMLYEIVSSLKLSFPQIEKVYCKSKIDLLNHLPNEVSENDFDDFEIVDKMPANLNAVYSFLNYNMIDVSDCVIYLRIIKEGTKKEKVCCYAIEKSQFIFDRF